MPAATVLTYRYAALRMEETAILSGCFQKRLLAIAEKSLIKDVKMVEMEYTPSQQAVINERKKNILVSAAAGSGKTAVLSERVVKKITDKATPIDVDRILVLTFTRQAAHEMKERIYQRLSELYARDPFNNNLRRQMLLLDNAKITTIDSFCAYIFKNYFQDAGVDTSLRIAE